MTGSELKKRRTALGYSQEKLAQTFEISVSTIARWEQLKDEEIPNGKILHLALLSLESV